MQKLQSALQQPVHATLFKEARFGIEKESQRVTPTGALAQTDHPSVFGNRRFHPYIQTDFSETQVEMITPVATSSQAVLEYLGAIHEVVLRSLPEGEMLWPLSMPPVLPADDREIKIAKLERFEEVLYRRYLAHSYGKRKQMVSGIHYNFEFEPALVKALFDAQSETTNFETFKSELYLKVSRHYIRYRWLITYLLGASPVSESGYFTATDAKTPTEPVRSIRNSDFGYTNHGDVFVSYASLEKYISDIERLVDEGTISEEKEFYASVRLRGGKAVADLATHGIAYIEVRNIDNDPYAPYGISQKTIEFLQLFLMYMLWRDQEETDLDQLLHQGDQYNNTVALEHPYAQTAFYDEGCQLVAGMKEMAQALELTAAQVELIDWVQTVLDDPRQTLAAQMLQEERSNHEFAVAQAQANSQQAWDKPYQLAGFSDLELSTQILLFDSIQRGVKVEVLDRHDQFLRLTHGKHVEYVKNGNMTSRDSYVVPLLMENKTVTKIVLAEAGFRVPQGKEFADLASAIQAYDHFAKLPFVIKPKSTNYGLGITIFKEGASRADFEQGLKIAFAEDSEVLIEEFLPGTEYRFFVINGDVKAILLRVPANVKGDGQQTIAQLVAEKNQDPLRGTDHRAPLELIQLGELEQLMLKEQGYTIDDVLPTDQVVYLRENSNISTGGDSIDVTAEIDASYKQIAKDAVAALGAQVSGIDLIIPDKDQVASSSPRSYGIIEANFNPAMHIHAYPFAGQGRRMTQEVLTMLFPELM